MPRSATIPAAFLSALALGLLACGVGPVKETAFSYGSMDSKGGTVEAGDITIVIPPDGLSQPTTIAILPEVNALTVLPPPDDFCTYTLLGPQWCCGPVGLYLERDGQCTVRYDETLIPATAGEDDLVLLLWNDALGALVPAADAVHDQDANQFVVAPYRELGHVAVGVAGCPEFRIVIAGAVQPSKVAQITEPGGSTEQTEEDPLITGMYLADLEGGTPPVLLPTNGEFPQAFVPSPDDERVLYLRYFFDENDSERRTDTALARQLYTVGIDGSDPVLVVGDDEYLTGYDPTYGWLRSGSTVYFQEYLVGDGEGESRPDEVRLATVPGGGGQPTSLYELGEYAWVDDLRQSPDGSLMLVRYYNGFEQEVIDVFEVATGSPVSEGVIPVGGGQATPRFAPDGSFVYLVSPDRDAVLAYAPDGSTSSTLFALSTEGGLLKDFVLAPGGDDYAYVLETLQSDDMLYVGSLTGGERAGSPLGPPTTYVEFLFHPNGQNVLLDTSRTSVRIFSSVDASEGPTLPAIDMRLLDIHEDTGQLLMCVPEARPTLEVSVPDGSAQQTAPVGVYLAEANGSSVILIPTPEGFEVEQARWLRTIRRAPGMPFENRIR